MGGQKLQSLSDSCQKDPHKDALIGDLGGPILELLRLGEGSPPLQVDLKPARVSLIAAIPEKLSQKFVK